MDFPTAPFESRESNAEADDLGRGVLQGEPGVFGERETRLEGRAETRLVGAKRCGEALAEGLLPEWDRWCRQSGASQSEVRVVPR